MEDKLMERRWNQISIEMIDCKNNAGNAVNISKEKLKVMQTTFLCKYCRQYSKYFYRKADGITVNISTEKLMAIQSTFL